MSSNTVSLDSQPFDIRKPDKPATPEPVDPKKKDWTAEEVEDLAQATIKSFFGDEQPEQKADGKQGKQGEKGGQQGKKALSTPENEPKPDDAPTETDDTHPPKPSKKPAPKKKDEPDMADKIAAKIGEQNEKLLERLSPKAPEPEPDPVSVAANADREAENQHLRQVFVTMAKNNPANAQLPQQFDEFTKKEAAYQAAWEKENPGKAFDPNAVEHEDWYEQNEPAYDERQFRRAEISVEADRLIAEREQQNQARSAYTHAMTLAEKSIETLSNGLEADLRKVLDDLHGDNTVLDNDGPIAEKYQAILSQLSDQINLASVLLTPGTGVAYNPKDPAHASFAAEVIDMDGVMAAASEQERRRIIIEVFGKNSKLLGKKYVKADDYQKLSPEEMRQSWNVCITPELVSARMAVKAKDSMSEWLNTLFTQVGKRKDAGGATQTPSEAGRSFQPEPVPGVTKPRPPGLGQGSSELTPQPGSSAKPSNSWESLGDSF